jgi:beta-galactosidase
MKNLKTGIAMFMATAASHALAAQAREHLLMDFNWRFAYGHPSDADKDFKHATGYFSYLAKAGYGDGPAAKDFDDRAWRKLDLPHDWAVEQNFDAKGSHSHGYKTVGRNFPDSSVGWYRKSFFVPESDLGRRISLRFDGVHRDSVVWVNGFYLGRQPNGYTGFHYDITDYLNYGGDNVVAVRADVTLEQGWYYEGAGIYRHVWLNKTAALHVDHDGTFVTTEVKSGAAEINARAQIVNEGDVDQNFEISQDIVDAAGKSVIRGQIKNLTLAPGASQEFPCAIKIQDPKLWSLETPYLYKLITRVHSGANLVDQVETSFGVRSIRFDPDQGFFLNGKHVKLKGTNNHQDHAGVGDALPDALQEFRIKCLKEMGSNAYRCSHNPPTPELLEACDRLGMLVLVENRLMGSSPELFDLLKRTILRDRNHPSVFAWSMGNEEWGIEGNVKGARIATTMQAFAKRLDPSRPTTVAVSGGNDLGISSVLELMGYNYIDQWDTDRHHAKYPKQPAMGTEESTTSSTRGVYLDEDKTKGHAAPTDREKDASGVERGWKYYVQRPYLSGLFYWTGFDYRGEPNPYGYPAVSSQFGLIDLCGFPKDPYYYLKAWWTDRPVLELLPHWNWRGREGTEIQVRVQSNCDEVELYLNGKSLGRKTMEKNGHLDWQVKYAPGTLMADSWKAGELSISKKVETTGLAAAVALKADRQAIKADGEDVSVITVQINDSKGRRVPQGGNEVTFSLDGPGKIIGVGNGDPSSHEPDKYIDSVASAAIKNLRMQAVDHLENRPEVAPEFNDSDWKPAFKQQTDLDGNTNNAEMNLVIRGDFYLGELKNNTEVTLLPKSLGEIQSLYVNGKLVAKDIKRDAPNQNYPLGHDIIHSGKNTYAMVGSALQKKHRWENLNTDPGVIRIFTPRGEWKRSVFNGLAQVLVQSEKKPGKITLKAESKGLSATQIKLETRSVELRAALP